MVPYYVMRYGFYEGHTGYRADPPCYLQSVREIVFRLVATGTSHLSIGAEARVEKDFAAKGYGFWIIGILI